MSWSDELIPMLRAMVADDGVVQKFSDSQLETLITTAARAVVFDGAQVGFAYPFAASVENQTITPDPTAPATLDDSFLYLVAAKATCILSRGALSKAAGQAIKIRSKDDELDLKEGYKGRLAVSVDACKEYKDLMSRYVIDRRNSLGGTVGYAVVTPVRVYA